MYIVLISALSQKGNPEPPPEFLPVTQYHHDSITEPNPKEAKPERNSPPRTPNPTPRSLARSQRHRAPAPEPLKHRPRETPNEIHPNVACRMSHVAN